MNSYSCRIGIGDDVEIREGVIMKMAFYFIHLDRFEGFLSLSGVISVLLNPHEQSFTYCIFFLSFHQAIAKRSWSEGWKKLGISKRDVKIAFERKKGGEQGLGRFIYQFYFYRDSSN